MTCNLENNIPKYKVGDKVTPSNDYINLLKTDGDGTEITSVVAEHIDDICYLPWIVTDVSESLNATIYCARPASKDARDKFESYIKEKLEQNDLNDSDIYTDKDGNHVEWFYENELTKCPSRLIEFLMQDNINNLEK